MTTMPASVAVELTIPCSPISKEEALHRVWLKREGSVETPDHIFFEDKVVEAIGGKPLHACAYWHALSNENPDIGNKVFEIPDRQDEWLFTKIDIWTQGAVWTGLSGLVGTRTFDNLDPVQALEHIKVYLRHGELPEDLVSSLSYLQAPWTRTSGYRKNTPTTPEELDALLQSRLPVNRVASASALGLTGETATQGVDELKRLNLPSDLLLNLAYALPIERYLPILSGISFNQAQNLITKLSTLKEKSEAIAEKDIEKFLLS